MRTLSGTGLGWGWHQLPVHSNVLHKAFIAVDEEGTEAAAATAVVMELTAVLDPPITPSIDRPFLFVMRDMETETILFMGRVLYPGS